MRKARTVKQFGRARARRGSFAITKFEVAKLELHDGDILVLRTDFVLDSSQATALRQSVMPYVPKDVQVLILTAGLSLAVLQDKRAA
jgi:hypothetical protein